MLWWVLYHALRRVLQPNEVQMLLASLNPPFAAQASAVLCCVLCCAVCRVLQPGEVEMLLASPNPPLFVLSAVGQLLAAADMRIESKTHMDESVRVLQEAAGSCEKIITTPIPLSYTR
jgi:hypothetical protein